MRPTSKKQLKRTQLLKADTFKDHKSARRLYRKKLTRLKISLRRQAFRIYRRKASSLWVIARPHLRAHASLDIASKRRRFSRTRSPYLFAIRSSRRVHRAFRKLIHILHHPRTLKNVRRLRRGVSSLSYHLTQLSSTTATAKTAAEQKERVKIISALLRRKRYRHKKLTYLFLKARRLHWLRNARLTKQKRSLRAKLSVRSKVKSVTVTLRPVRLRPTDKVIDVPSRVVNVTSGASKVSRTAKVIKGNSITAVSEVNKKAVIRSKACPITKVGQRKLLPLSFRKGRALTTRWKRLKRINQRKGLAAARKVSGLRHHRVTLLRRARRPVLSRQSRPWRAKSRRLKILKIRKRQRTKLRLRRQHCRRYRKLRKKVNKRASARNRRSIMTAASRPVRQHRHYKRLLRTRRVAVAIQEIYTLRPTPAHVFSTKKCNRANKIGHSWRPLLARETRRDYPRYQLPVFKKTGVKVKKVVQLFPRPEVNFIGPLTAEQDIKVQLFPQRKICTFGPLTLEQTEARRRALRNLYFPKGISKKGLRQVFRGAVSRRRLIRLRAQRRYRRATTRPFLNTGLPRKRFKNAARNNYLTATRAALHKVTRQLRALKNRPATARKVRNLDHFIVLAQRTAYRLQYSLDECAHANARKRKRLLVRYSPITALRLLSITEKHRTFTAHGLHTPEGRLALIRRYRLVGRFPRTHLYDPRPRVDFTPGILFTRKSRRYKRLAKRARVTVKKSKRQLRRRFRKKVVIVRKRMYLHTERSPVHTGRTVAWKKKGINRRFLHQKLALTRGLFRELLRAEQPLTATSIVSRPPTTSIRSQVKAEQLGRALLWALLQFTAEVAGDKHSTAITRLRTTARLLLRRTATLTAPVVRLLLLKTLALPALTTADSKKRGQLLTLERHWLSACTPLPAAQAVLRRKSSLTARKMVSRLRSQRSTLALSLHRRLFAVANTASSRTGRFAKTYSKNVKRLLTRRQFKVLLHRLKLREKRHSRKTVRSLRRQRAMILHNWQAVSRYHRVRRIVTHGVLSRLRIRIRRGVRWAIRAPRISILRKVYQRASTRGRKVQLRRKQHEPLLRLRRMARSTTNNRAHKTTNTLKAELSRPHRVLQQRSRSEAGLAVRNLLPLIGQTHTTLIHRQLSARLRTRLDAARLRTRKALLWKAPLQRRPPVLLSRRKRQKRWHCDTVMRQKGVLKVVHQELRRPMLSAPGQHFRLPVAITPVRRWRAVRINRRCALPLSRVTVRLGTAVTPFKKFQPRNRLSRIGRAAARPKRPDWRTRLPRRRQKKARAKKANAFRIRAFRRSMFFRKNRVFMRRRSTKGFWEAFDGNVTILPGAPRYANRPLRTRLRRSKPLRRSLRRQLAKVRSLKRKPARFRRSVSATGRLFAKLIPKYTRRKPWIRQQGRKQMRANSKKVQIADQLLQRFAHIAAMRPYTLTPTTAQKITTGAAVLTPARRLLATKVAATPIRLILQVQHRAARLRRLRSRVTAYPPVRYWVFRNIQHDGLTRTKRMRFRRIRSFQVRQAQPGKTWRKYRWMRREYRKRSRTFSLVYNKNRSAATRSNVYGLLALAKRRGLLRAKTQSSSSKPLLILHGPRATNKISNKGVKKLPAKQLPLKTKAPVARPRNAKEQLHVKSTAVTTKQTATKAVTPAVKSTVVNAVSTTVAPKGQKFAASTVPAKPIPQKTVTQPASITRFQPLVEPGLSAPMAKKIDQFNREKNVYSKRAYDAIMSGLKSSWTSLKLGNSGVSLKQQEQDAVIMERLYTKHYGSVVRYDTAAVLDFKKYEAKRNGVTPSSTLQ